jgi:hypothetical protein
MTLERNNTLVVHVGYVANVPYLLCYALKAIGYKCINIIPRSILNSIYSNIFYGSITNDNPLNVNILSIDDNLHYDFILNIIKYLNKLKIKYGNNLIVHLHIGSALRDLLIIKTITKLYGIKLFVSFHGTDLRDISLSKALLLKMVINKPFFVSTPDLLAYCRHFDLECTWLPNPIDPIVIDKAKYRKYPNNLCNIFIPTRFDYTKELNKFFDQFIQLAMGLRDVKCVVTWIIWPNTISDVKPTYSKLKNLRSLKVQLLPLLDRGRLIKMYLDHNIVVGQFKLGALGMTELEALASLNHVLMGPLNVTTCLAYKDAPPVIEVRDTQDIMNAIDRALKGPNKDGIDFVMKHHNPLKIAEHLVNLYDKL